MTTFRDAHLRNPRKVFYTTEKWQNWISFFEFLEDQKSRELSIDFKILEFSSKISNIFVIQEVSNHKIAFLIFNKYCSFFVRNLKFGHIFPEFRKFLAIVWNRKSDSWKRWSRHFISFAKNSSKDFLIEGFLKWASCKVISWSESLHFLFPFIYHSSKHKISVFF